MPCIASATMISIPKKRPHFRATSRLGKPSGLRTSFSSCTPTVIPCTCFLELVLPRFLFFVPLGDKHELIPPVSHFSSKRLLEVIESPIILARHLVLPTCETWVHKSYTIALLGEAAHPNLVSRAFQHDDASDWFSWIIFSSSPVLLDFHSSSHFHKQWLSCREPGRRHILSICPCGGTAVC